MTRPATQAERKAASRAAKRIADGRGSREDHRLYREYVTRHKHPRKALPAPRVTRDVTPDVTRDATAPDVTAPDVTGPDVTRDEAARDAQAEASIGAGAGPLAGEELPGVTSRDEPIGETKIPDAVFDSPPPGYTPPADPKPSALPAPQSLSDMSAEGIAFLLLSAIGLFVAARRDDKLVVKPTKEEISRMAVPLRRLAPKYIPGVVAYDDEIAVGTIAAEFTGRAALTPKPKDAP